MNIKAYMKTSEIWHCSHISVYFSRSTKGNKY